MKRKMLIIFIFVICLAIILAACGSNPKPDPTSQIYKTATAAPTKATTKGAGIAFTKSDITETAQFIPYEVDGVKMEVVAVKAPDGTVRTALNTCQVCYDSGRGYYKQQGDVLVCQNCGNRFKISQLEKEKNGCNPVPILENDKKDDGTTVTISDDILRQARELFLDWKR